MKKKIISMLLALALLPCSGIWAMAAEEDEGLVFEMDLTEYSNTDGVVKNAVTGLSDGIEIKGAANGARPRLEAISSMQGETPYLAFSALRGRNTFYHYGSVDLSKELCAPLQNQQAMSVEFWVNYLATESGATASSRIFNFGPETGATDSNNSYEIYVYDTQNQYFVRYARAGMNPSQYLEQRINVGSNMNRWTHYVLTREWDEESQAYTGTVYVNGVSQGEVTGGIKIDETDFRVQIGNMAGEDVLNGGLATFKLYHTALTPERVAEKYNESRLGFMELAETMHIISPTEGTTLDTAPGEIEIRFDNYVDLDTIDGITFRKADGTEITGGIRVYAEEDITMSVFVKYGKLDSDAVYILDIPDTVCSLNGISCGGKQLEYRTEGFYIFYEDFEDYEVGDKPDGTKLLYTSSDAEGSLEDVVVKEASGNTPERKKKYISMVTNADENLNSNSTAAVVFDTPITYDFVVEVGVRGQNGTAAARNTRFYGSAGEFSIVGNFQNGVDLRSDTSMGEDKDKHDALYKEYSTSATDEFGFIRMKYVFQKDTDGKYVVTGTCLDDPNVDYRMPLIHTDCTQFMAIQQYNAPNTDMCVDLSYVKVYRYSVPEIVSDNTAELDQDSEEISLVFSEDIDPATVTESCARLVNTKTGETVLTKVTGYDEAARQMRVKLGEYLDWGVTYDLFITDIRTTSDVPIREGEKLTFTFRDYDLTVTDLSVQNENGVEISSLNGAGSVTVSADIRNSGTADKNAKVFAVLYDKDHVYQASAVTIEPVRNGAAATISAVLPDITPEEGDYLEVYVWEKTDGGQIVVLQDSFIINF